VRHCNIQEEPVSLLINASTRQLFTYNDSCVEFEPHVGHDATATEASKTSSVALFCPEVLPGRARQHCGPPRQPLVTPSLKFGVPKCYDAQHGFFNNAVGCNPRLKGST